jgi:hypothetical protein
MEQIEGNSNKDCGNPQEGSQRRRESCRWVYESTCGVDGTCESIVGAEKRERATQSTAPAVKNISKALDNTL